MMWGALFIFLPGISQILRDFFQRRWSYEEAWYFGLLSIWKNLEWISKGFFGIQPERYLERTAWSLGVLLLLAALAIFSYWKNIRGVGARDD